MSKEMLRRLNQIATKSYKFFIALVAIVFVFLRVLSLYLTLSVSNILITSDLSISSMRFLPNEFIEY